MILSFQPQFVEKVLNGSKLNTIRENAGDRWIKGTKIHFYKGNPRNVSQNPYQFGEGVVTEVLPIQILPNENKVFVAALPVLDLEVFARADGFTSWAAMRAFFPNDFEGSIIFWEKCQPVSMTDEQNEIINKCLMLAYSTDGTPEMGELAAQAHGLELQYKQALRRIKLDCKVIVAALVKTGYYDGKTGAYSQFNIRIGANKNDIYDGRFEFVLPYAVRAFLSNEPLELHFVAHSAGYFYGSHGSRKGLNPCDSAPMQLKIANAVKKIIDSRFAGEIAGLQTVALKINHASGETTINK
jgi:hypothetical protein